MTPEAPAAQYFHEGTPIYLDAQRGTFNAVVGKKKITAPSLLSIKKKIEATKLEKFEEFDALAFDRVGNYHGSNDKLEVRAYRVTEINVERNRWGSKALFVASRTDRKEPRFGSSSTVRSDLLVLDTPENRKLIAAYHKLALANKKVIDRLEAETEKALKAIPKTRASDYITKSKKS